MGHFPRDAQRAKNPQTPVPFFANLFLRSALSLSLILSTLLTSTLVSLVASCGTQSRVGTTLDGLGHLALLDLLDGKVGGGDGHDRRNGGGLVDLGQVRLGVTLLGGVGLARKQDEALPVGLEAGHVDGQALLGEILAAVVDRDTDGAGQRSGNASLLFI